MHAGELFVISGPSGAGKGTLVARLVERMPDCWVSVSNTTRKPRPGEIDGIHYFFVTNEEFDALVERDGFLEYAHVHDDRYGTPRERVESHLEQGETVILEIDVQGGLQVRSKAPYAHLVFIEPPSLEELRRRLESRGTDAPDAIERRLKVAEVELSHKMQYDYTLVNDDLDKATEELVAYVQSILDKDGNR